jgi:TonB family protein
MLLIILLAFGLPQTGSKSDSISAQAVRALSCGRVIAVSCTSPSSPATLLVAPDGADRNWRIVIPAEQRHLFGSRLENSYEEQLVCVHPRAWSGARDGLVTVSSPDQLVIKNAAQPATNVSDDISRSCDSDVQPPVLVRDVHAPMTPTAMRAKVNGGVMLRGVVDRDGAVSDVRVVKSLEPTQDAAARDAFSQWTFRPALRGGKPVPMAVTVQMAYTTR